MAEMAAPSQSLLVGKEVTSNIQAAGWNNSKIRKSAAAVAAMGAGASLITAGALGAVPMVIIGGSSVVLLGAHLLAHSVFGKKYENLLGKVGIKPSDVSLLFGLTAATLIGAASVVNMVAAGAANVADMFVTIANWGFFGALAANDAAASIQARKKPTEAGLQVGKEVTSQTVAHKAPEIKGLGDNVKAGMIMAAGALIAAAGAITLNPAVISIGSFFFAHGVLSGKVPEKSADKASGNTQAANTNEAKQVSEKASVEKAAEKVVKAAEGYKAPESVAKQAVVAKAA